MWGVDGCPAGWVAVSAEGEARVLPAFADVLRACRGPVALDMPIGLLEAGRTGDRPCDKAARGMLGPRRASVFAPPTRAALAATAWTPGLGLSRQGFGILPKVREVDALMTPARQRRVAEAHPELAFALLAGAPMRHPKRSAEGRRERARALGSVPGDPFRALRRDPRAPGARPDDVLDACALAWTAGRLARGEALRMGGGRDARGLRMEIRA